MKQKQISTKTWGSKEITLLRLLYPTRENKYISKLLNKSDSAIRNAAKRYGVKKTQWCWPQEQISFMLKNWESLSAQEIADSIGRTRWAVINKHREINKRKKSN